MHESCRRSSTTQIQMDPVYNNMLVTDMWHWFISHFSNFGFFDNSGIDCTSNKVDCNGGLCGRLRGMLHVGEVKLTPGYMIFYMFLFYKNTDILISYK